MKDPKQTIVVRKDLKMRKGKLAAQTSHASMKPFFDRIDPASFELNKETGMYSAVIDNITPEMKEWMEGIFTKIVVGCQSEEEILDLQSRAKALDIPFAIITDCGKTEFGGVPTVTCISIGPAKAELVESITRDFPLM